MDVPARLQELMDERGLNVYALAQASGVSWQTVKNIFTLTSNPSVGTLTKICKGLGITMSQFFATEEDNVISLTTEQNLLNRWRMLSEDEKRLYSELLDVMVSKGKQ